MLVQKWIDLDHKSLNPFNKPAVLVVSGVDLKEQDSEGPLKRVVSKNKGTVQLGNP